MYRLLILVLILYSSIGHAQNEMNLSTINLSVVLPTNFDGLSVSHLSKLESKIIEVVSRNGVSATGYTQNFVIYPKFEIYDEKQSQGGMRNITLVNCNLSLFIKQLSSNIIFSSYSKSLQGSGFNKNEALNNAISSVDASDKSISEFVNAAKDKIIKYYVTNCDIVLKKAESERSIKNYESSLSILLSVPEEAKDCYDKAQINAKPVFAELQIYSCKKFIQFANTSAAAYNFDEALYYLSLVDPTGPCVNESKDLISALALKVGEEQKKRWDFLLQAYADAVALEKLRIEAMNNLAIAWLKNQSSSATYINIIR